MTYTESYQATFKQYRDALAAGAITESEQGDSTTVYAPTDMVNVARWFWNERGHVEYHQVRGDAGMWLYFWRLK